jgi:formylglycine-generating enzyme required for sulfatase activity
MKKRISISIIVLLLFSSMSILLVSARKANDKAQVFIQFEANLFSAPYEVTNKEYRQFLAEIKTVNPALYSRCIYDSTLWSRPNSISYGEPMTGNYHSHPAYDNHPMVNISMEAANAYCSWLTESYHLNPNRKHSKVVFRLPHETEWQKLAAPLPGHNLPWYGHFPYQNDKSFSFLTNIKLKDFSTGLDDYISDGSLFTTSIGAYKPNNLGIYDVIGNVAEMTSEGKIKGGSWDCYLDECTVEIIQNYSLPNPRVGFRVVMEVLDR